MLRPGPGFGEDGKRKGTGNQAVSGGMKLLLLHKDSPAWKRKSLCGGEELGGEIAAATAAVRGINLGHAGIGGYGHTLAAEINGRPLVGEAEQVGQGGDDSGKAGVNLQVRGVADNPGYTTREVGEHGVGDFVNAAGQGGDGGALVALPHPAAHQQESSCCSVINDGVGPGRNDFGETISESASADLG